MEEELLLAIRATDQRAAHILWLMQIGGMEEKPAEFIDEILRIITWMVIKKQRGALICAVAPDLSGLNNLVSTYLDKVAENSDSSKVN